MTYDTIKLDIADGIARLTFNRPDRLNALTVPMHGEITDAIGRIEADRTARVVVLTGAGRGFCAGQDLNERVREPGAPPPDLGESIDKRYNPLFRRLAALDRPLIAAVNGVAAGAGVSFALACDLVVAARSARFIQSFAKIGLVPDTGATWLVPRLVGHARAMGLALTAQPIDAEQAAEWGLIWKAVDDDALEATVTTLAASLAAGPTRGLVAIRQLLRGGWERSFDAQLDEEGRVQAELGRTEDYAEGVAAFMARRPPNFTGR